MVIQNAWNRTWLLLTLPWWSHCSCPLQMLTHGLGPIAGPGSGREAPEKGGKLFILLPKSSFSCLLLISTSNWVLCTLFAGQNHLFHHFNIFSFTNEKNQEKSAEKRKIYEKREWGFVDLNQITKNISTGVNQCLGFNQLLGVAPKHSVFSF